MITVTITGQNDAPVMTVGTHPTLDTITEHDVNNPGQTVASFIGPVSDADKGALSGIAITGLDSGNGHWEYSTNGGSSWYSIGPVCEEAALLLRGSDLVRFVPNDQSGTTASLTYHAWDRTTGFAGDTVNVSVSGGTTAFSSASDTASITVAPVNDAPVGPG